MEIGYIRVSSASQSTERQLLGINIDKEFTDHQSGKDRSRPELQKCLEFLRSGDTLHVHSIDRLARNLQDLLDLLNLLKSKEVTVHFHKENLIFTGDDSPMHTLYLQIIGAVAEFERAIIRERQREGVALAKQRKVYKGRQRTLSLSRIQSLIAPINEGMPVVEVARKLGVSRNTIYRWIKLVHAQELKT